MDKLLTVNDVARIFNVSSATVRKWIQAGLIAYITLPTIGKRDTYRIREVTVDALIEMGSTKRGNA